jgi:hypothetical protein
MEIVLIIAGIILGLIFLFLLAALFAGKEFTVQRQIVINASNREVFSYLSLLSNHRSFSKWTTKDPAKPAPSRGTDGTVGYVLGWDNYKDKAGIGELEIKGIQQNRRIDLEHHYQKPVKGFARASLITVPEQGNTLVKWVYNGVSPYPLNLLTSIMDMDKLIGKDLDKGLVQLKKQLEGV